MEHMKWWGWGDPAYEFPMHEKPLLWPFVNSVLGLSPDCAKTPPVDRATATAFGAS